MMTSAQAVAMSVNDTTNSLSQDYIHFYINAKFFGLYGKKKKRKEKKREKAREK